jgi:hypothetical protein
LEPRSAIRGRIREYYTPEGRVRGRVARLGLDTIAVGRADVGASFPVGRGAKGVRPAR